MSANAMNKFLEDSYPLLDEVEKLANYLIKEFMRIAL